MGGTLGNATWSGLLQNPQLTSGSQPLPILLATGRTVQDGTNDYTPDGTIYEMTPYEFGSWDPINTGAFISMAELGTSFFKGYPTPQGICISGFDNAA
jgi:lysophospholipase